MTQEIELSKLELDKTNPRFGLSVDSKATQTDLLNKIVDTFGVEDVLSSIAVNGYFSAEPLVCKSEGGKFIVLEGNRRLAACLIITGDERAKNQSNLTAHYNKIWTEHDKKKIDPVPAVVFDGTKKDPSLLSYLGVRHIASSQPWDSYAKAAWVAKVIENNDFRLDDVALMIGDNNRTIARLLEGYHFANQVIAEGKFQPEDSIRKGRGSVTEYPFSWIYTVLGYSTARKYLGLGDDPTKPNPIPKENLGRASLLTTAMFGNKRKGTSSAITDSRQIGDLASILADADKVAMLEAGKSIEEIARVSQPLDERLRKGLTLIGETQKELITAMVEQNLSKQNGIDYKEMAGRNKRTAAELEKKLIDASEGESR